MILINATRVDKPVFGLNNFDITYFIKYFFGYVPIWLNLKFEILSYLFSMILFFIFVKFRRMKTELIILFVLVNFQLFLLPILFNRPIPYARLLIPFLPVVIIWLFCIFIEKSEYSKIFTIFSLILFLNTVFNINLFNSYTWPETISRFELTESINNSTLCGKTKKYGIGIEYYILLNKVDC